MDQHALDCQMLRRALELAARGEGAVEPNPMVGCVIAHGPQIVGEGWHRRYGGPHAEIEALAAAGERAAGATMFVSLEPCCHHGKTPPCTEAILRAGIRRVVVALLDPFPQVRGGGVTALREAGLEVEVGSCRDEALHVCAPYLKLVGRGRPFVIAKWAMTLDGKLAARTGESRWISGEASRAVVHRLRGRVDAILVGRNTAMLDDPLLTARPPGARVAARIVVDTMAELPPTSRLVQSADAAPVIVAAGSGAPSERVARLRERGCEVLLFSAASYRERLGELLDELGRRRMTNVLVEGGAALLGSLFDAGEIDEVHAFIAPTLLGGATAPSPVAGRGLDRMAEALRLTAPVVEVLDGDVYVHGRLAATPGSRAPTAS